MGLELEPLLVDGECVDRVDDVGWRLVLEKAVVAEIDFAEDCGNAERADRIPDAEHLDAGGVHLPGLVEGVEEGRAFGHVSICVEGHVDRPESFDRRWEVRRRR